MKEPTLETHLGTLVLIVVGLIFLMVSSVPQMLETAVFMFTLSVGFMLLGCYNALHNLHWMEKLHSHLKQRARQQNSGIIWVWVVFAIGCFIFAILYISLAWPVMLCLDIIEGSYSFSSVQSQTFLTIRTVFAWTPIIFLFGMMMWALVNSTRREESTYPVYYG